MKKETDNGVRRAVMVQEPTHARLTRLLQKEIVKNKGRRVTYDDMLNKLMDNHGQRTV